MGTPPTIEFASLGMADTLILMVLALVVFGPRRLPEIGRQLGKLMYEFRKASNDFKFQMEEELRAAAEADRRKEEEARLRALAPPAQPALTIEASPQVSEAASAAPAEIAAPATPLESPYPGEAVYPPAPAPAAEAPAAETHPLIQPPSTGEQVPAARPWNLEDELAKVSAAADPGSGAGELPAAAHTDQTTPATEPAAKNG
jgi:sec-independent protein translocase protein TatB